MYVSSITPSSVASAIWANAVRTLTSVASVFSGFGAFNTSIAAATVLQISGPSSGAWIYATLRSGAAGNSSFGLYNVIGPVFYPGLSISATNATSQAGLSGDGIVFAVINNDAVNAAFTSYTGWVWT